MSARDKKALLFDPSQPSTHRRLYRVIKALPEGIYAIDINRKRWTVGQGQRGYYWGYLVVEVGRLIGKDRDKTDKILNALFLSESYEVAGETVAVVRSLSDLDPAAASIYFEDIANWVWVKFNVRLTEPDPTKRKSLK
ncbi:hypothetical protein M0L20_29560 [Spirosoma sp. RP8]|uniref:Uncharacterized protein n=1 Tax=Spirosoma liriopis TaxID=2937440 RepID=A0ABT0HV38_9BACT|nr:hypothetical protein [Spirosoma liriopis]MCK8496050.1 hypothetical protein [Spirosoma liriopis]